MPHPSYLPVTRLLAEMGSGADGAHEQLISYLYEDLRGLAFRAMGRRDRSTLQPTALVHEAYLRILGSDGSYRDRQHFLAVAAMAMRQLVADHARQRRRLKRGGDRRQVTLDEGAIGAGTDIRVDLIDLDEALDALASIDARQARIVELRFFAGMTVEEAAEVVGVSQRTVKLDWQMARAWLLRRLQEPGS